MDSSSYLVGALGYTLIPNGSAPSVGKSFTLTTTRPENLKYLEWSAFMHSHRNGLRVIPVSEKALKANADTKMVREKIAARFKNSV